MYTKLLSSSKNFYTTYIQNCYHCHYSCLWLLVSPRFDSGAAVTPAVQFLNARYANKSRSL
jgi:hypothetical protein